MKKILLLLALLCSCVVGAQVYPMQNGTFSTCSGTFYDSGGVAGNYGPNEVYQITFCPPTPGSYVQLNFTDFDIEGEPFDFMRIYEGTGTAGALIGSFGLTSPVTCNSLIASSHPSGCITVTFVSDGSFQYGGWAATISCSTTPGGTGSGAPSNAVCSGANPFCADAGPLEFPNISDAGCVPDAPTVVTDNTCLITAPNPAWYFLEIGIAGNVNLEIEQTTGPNGTGTGLDVDYAIWGPFANGAAACADFTQGDCVGDHACSGNVVDCSFSIDAIETATIPNALVGQIYMVLITNFDGAPGYITMTQTNAGSTGAGSTDCSIVCPTFAGTNPTTCGATNGSITISHLDPNTTYTVTYLDDLAPVSTTVTSNASGVAVITGLNAGNYTNILTNYPGCSSASGTVLLTGASSPAVTSITSNTPICSGGSAIFTITGTANATLTYNINGSGSATVVLNAAGTATVTVNPALANVTLNAVSVGVPGCVAPLAISRTVVVNTAASIVLTSGAATSNQTICNNSVLTTIVYTIGNGGTGATVIGLPAGVTGTFSGTQFTISGTPTATGTFNYTVTTTGGCGTASLGGTITVNPGVTIALFSASATTNQAVCINTLITSIVYTIGGGATGATVMGLPAGLLASYTAGQFTIAGIPSASGTFNYTVTTTGGCGTGSLGGTITVNPNATIALTSAAATTSQTLCSSAAITSIVYAVGGGATGATVTGLPSGVTGVFSGGQFTISGTPTVTGTFNYTVTTTGGCGSASSGGTITIDPIATIALTSAAATTNQTLCINTVLTPIVYTIANATGATVLGLPAGVSGTYSAGQFTITGTPSVTGTFNYTVTTTGGCGSASLGGTITISPDATIALVSAVATTNQTLCASSPITAIVYAIGGGGTGATVTGLPAGVTGTFAAGQFTITGLPTAGGTFNYTVTTTGGCVSASLGGTITVNSDATIAQTSPAGTEIQTICINNAVAPIVYAITNGTGATVLGLPTGVTGNYAAGVFTVSGTPTVSGSFNFTVTATGSGCASPAMNGTITIDADATLNLTSAVATTNQTLCTNTALTLIVYTIGGGGTGATVTNLPPGVTANFVSGQLTISGSPTNTGTFNYTVTTTGGCASATLGGTITVDPGTTISLTSAPATATQTLCINTPITTVVFTVADGGTGATVLGLPMGVAGSYSAGQFTITGSPTETGIFNYTVSTTGGCGSASIGGTITIDAAATIVLASAPATTNQTICTGAAITPIDYTTTNATGATVTGLPTGLTGNFSGGQFTITGTPTANGTFNYTVTTTGGCGSVSLGGTITVNAGVTLVLTSAAGTDNQTLCVNTGVSPFWSLIPIVYQPGNGATGATVTGLPAGVIGNFSAGSFQISGWPTAVGTFNYTVTTTGGCGSVSINGTITVEPLAAIVLTSAPATTNQNLCINTVITPIEYTVSGSATGVTAVGLPVGVIGNFASGLFTISGTPTTSGTFNYVVSTSGGCLTDSLTGTITIEPEVTMTLTSAAGTDSQSLCSNSLLTSIVYTTANGATGATVTGLPTGVTGNFAAGQFTISGTPTAIGIFSYTVTTTGGCGSVSLNGTITVDPGVTITLVSAASGTNQTLCTGISIGPIEYNVGGGATGATVLGLPLGVTAVFTAGQLMITGTPTVTGIFNYTVTTTGGCGSASLTGTITIVPDDAMVLSSAPATTNQTLCINTLLTPIIYTLGGGATGATVVGLPAGVTGNFAGGQFTLSGTPIAWGTFAYVVTTTGSCASVSLTGVITVDPEVVMGLSSAVGTNNQLLCINTPLTNIVYTTANGATGATVSGLPAGITGSFAGTQMTISGTPTVSGTFNYVVTTIGGCGSISLTGTITINPDATMVVSTGGTLNQSRCINDSISPVIFSVSNGVTGVTATGLPPGISGVLSGNLYTISGIITASGTYNYSVTTVGGCGSVTLNGTFTVWPLGTIGQLTPTGTEHQTVCVNAPITNINYMIGGSATGATVLGLPIGVSGAFAAGILTISGTPTATGTFNFTVTATGSPCNSPALSGTIVVNTDVTITLLTGSGTPSQTVCVNSGIAQIRYAIDNGATGATITNLPPGVTGSFSGGVVTINGIPTVAGVYAFNVTSVGGCGTVSANGIIVVDPSVTMNLLSPAGTDNQVVCTGTPITAIQYETFNNATGATVTGLPAGLTSAFSPTGVFTISGTPTVSGEFNYTVTTTGGCSAATLSGSVSVNPNVTIGLTSAASTTAQILCANTPIAPITYLVGNGATGAIVMGLPTGVSGNFAAGVLTIWGTPTVGGVFNYTAVTTGGCSSANLNGSLTITILPTATISYPSTPYCNSILAAQPITLSGTGAYLTGSFSAPTGLLLNTANGAISPALSTPGTYTVTYTIPGFGGCPPVIATTSVTITETPTATIAYNGPYCTAVNTIQPVILNGTAAYMGGSFVSTPGLSINNGTGAINPSLSTPGTYTIVYTIPASGGCGAVPVSTSVTINATPIAVATPDATEICTDDTITIDLTSLVAGTTYEWTVVQSNASGASNGSGNQISQTLVATGNSAGWAVYTIVPTSPAGCVGDAVTVTIRINPLPKPHLDNGVICRNPNTGILMRSYILNTGLSDVDYDFLWLHNTAPISGATDSTYEAIEDGIYTVIATNVHTGCISYPVDATVSETEIAEIAVVTGNTMFVDNPTVTVTVVGNGNYEYQLDNGPYQVSNEFSGLTLGEHTIHVRDQDDCTDITTTFTVIGYPKFFTPNGDGYNDTWNITALADQKASKISIFDRYGKLIKQISPGGEGWDGTLNGYELPATDYWFVVEYLDQQIGKEFKAHFSLKR